MMINQRAGAANGGFISATAAAQPAVRVRDGLENESPRKTTRHPVFPVCPSPAICLSPTHCVNRYRAQTACKLRGRPRRNGIRSLTLTLISPREEKIED